MCLAVNRGRAPGRLLESPAEIIRAVVAHFVGDVGDLTILLAQEAFGLLDAHLSQEVDDGAVELFFEEIRNALQQNEQVKLSGFGNFDLRDKRQRPGRNPKTGEEIPITARRVVTFRPGQKLKARVEAYAGTQP